MLFETYIVNPVRISYNSHSHDFEIHDGRHRIALGLEKGIAVPVRLGLIKDFERASELTKRDEYYAIMQPDVKKQTLVDLIRDEQAYIIKNKERIPVSILSAKTEKIKQGINIYKTEDKIPHYYKQTEEYDER